MNTPATTRSRTCLQLGVCQDRTPPCDGRPPRAPRFAPGVIDGPYHRERRVFAPIRKVARGFGLVVAWLMGPHP